MARPKIKKLAKADRRAFQEHVWVGLRQFGIRPDELRRGRIITSAIEVAKATPAELKELTYLVWPKKGHVALIEPQKAVKADRDWVRNHLRPSDPHFTHAVARQLFNMVMRHPKFIQSKDDGAFWISRALQLEGMNPAYSDIPAAVVPPISVDGLATILSDAVVDAGAGTRSRKGAIKKAIASKLRQDGKKMARQHALLVGWQRTPGNGVRLNAT